MPNRPVLTDLLDFLRESPTPYHAVDSAARRLAAAGYRRLDETAPWETLAPGGYWVENDGSTLLAFHVPAAAPRAFRIVGAHTDSPNLRLKPLAPYRKAGYHQLGVEVYGGVLLNSWLDRDLSLAGRVVLRGAETRRIRFERPLARVAQLAIHLDREVTDKGLILNKQEHMAPILGLASGDDPADLVALCAAELGIAADDVLGLDLMLYDVVPPTLGGVDGEFLFSGRLDNLAMCHAAVTALVAASARETDAVPLVALFNHEEVGSASATGAGSGFLPRLLERITLALGCGREAHLRAVAASLCLSADMAHAVHPNYADRHEARHRPAINGGPVVKVNSQQRYATCARTAALFQGICRDAAIPVQTYVHRTDLACGSTIGPITATLLGIPTVDVGNPMLSMHSIREMGGSRDPEMMVAAMRGFLSLEA